jgi:HEAT repeat protein
MNRSKLSYGLAGALLLVVLAATSATILRNTQRPVSDRQLREQLSESDKPAKARIEAIAQLGARQDLESIPELLKAMEDPDPYVRGRAGIAVRRILQVDLGFRAEAEPEDRLEKIGSYREHWQLWKAAHVKK